MKIILQTRWKQTLYFFQLAGAVRTIFVFILFIYLAFSIFNYCATSIGATIAAALNFAAVAMLHFFRKDKQFLNLIVTKPLFIFLVEYLLLSFLTIVSLIYFRQFLILIIFLAFVFGVSFFKKELKIKQLIINPFQKISGADFEYAAGFRKNFIWLLTLHLLAVIFFNYIAVIPIIVIIEAFVISSFFVQAESEMQICLWQLSAKKFLFRKIWKLLKIWNALTIPLIILWCIVFSEILPFAVAIFIFLNIFLIYSLLAKYAFFRAEKKMTFLFVYHSLDFIKIIIPFFLPILLFLLIRFYFKSIQNLNTLLYAFSS